MLFDSSDIQHYSDHFNRSFHFNTLFISSFLTIIVIHLICHKTPRQSENLKFYLMLHQILSYITTFTGSMASQFITSYPLCAVVTLGPLHLYGITTMIQTAAYQAMQIATAAISCVCIFYRYQCLLPVNSPMKIRQKYLKTVLTSFFVIITFTNLSTIIVCFWHSDDRVLQRVKEKEPILLPLIGLPNSFVDVCVPNYLLELIALLITIIIIFHIYIISLYGSYIILRRKNNFRSEKTRKMQISHTIALVIQMVFPSVSLGIPGFYITIGVLLDIRTEYDRGSESDHSSLSDIPFPAQFSMNMS